VRNSLADAVSELGLEPGQTFQATVAGCEVQIRRPAEPAVIAPPPRTGEPADDEPSQFADMVMLEPWVDLGAIPSPDRITVIAKFGALPFPDPPVVPPDDEVSE
jgi:hypothetical protein